MRRRLPPLNALRSFEAAARHESFTRAADELSVTQGAVSQQVKALEAHLGLKLFNRERQRLAITGAGQEYLGVVRDALDRLSLGTERLLQRQNTGSIAVSTTSDFAAKWLVHRLGRFHGTHPEISLTISVAAHQVDFVQDEADIAIRRGHGQWPGLHAERLATERLFAVCSPSLLRDSRIVEPVDLLKFPIFHADDREAWKRWLEAAGLSPARLASGPVLNSSALVIDAAVDGHGVALARSILAARDLISGRLVRPFEASLELRRSYWIVCPKATAALPKIETFRSWVLAEAAEDARALAALGV